MPHNEPLGLAASIRILQPYLEGEATRMTRRHHDHTHNLMLLLTPPVLPSDTTHENYMDLMLKFADRLDALVIRQDAAVHTQEAAHLALILRCATHDDQGREMQPQVPQLALAPAAVELSQEWWNGVFQRHDARRVAATRDAAIRVAQVPQLALPAAVPFARATHDDQGRAMQPQVPQLALSPAAEIWRRDLRRPFAPDWRDDSAFDSGFAVLHEIDDQEIDERSTMNTSRKIPTI